MESQSLLKRPAYILDKIYSGYGTYPARGLEIIIKSGN